MADIFSHCPNCGTLWPDGAQLCPHCGYVQPGASAWPPSPTGFPAPPPPILPTLLTGAAWGDMTLGIGISFVSNLLCLGFIVMPILYFTLKLKYPIFARGIGYGFLAGIVLLLGAFGVCVYQISHSNSTGNGL